MPPFSSAPFKMSNREKIFLSLAVIFGVIIFFGEGHLPSAMARDQKESDIFEELKTFSDVVAIVRRDYVQPVDNKVMIEGAIKGLLSNLDPHSGYLDPDYYQDLQVQTEGEFGGLGIEITIKDGMLVVVAPMEDSPAAKAGVQPGDAIVKIEGKFTQEFSLVDAVKRLRGPKGAPITVTIQRGDRKKLFDVTIVRDNIKVRSVKSRYLGDGLAYVRISQFMKNTGQDVRAALDKLRKKSPDKQIKGLILDVRNNPGGLLTQAISIGDLFLKDGVIVYTDGRVESQKQKFFAHERGTEPEYPMIVLVNGGSASASEIIAGAFKDHGRALILGTQTFGKGSVQTITPLRNGGAITLTTALYYTKSGNSIQAKGVTPDILVEAQDEAQAEAIIQKEEERERRRIRESELPGAISNPNGQNDPIMKRINKTPTESPKTHYIDPESVDLKEWVATDTQFQRSYDLLKTFDIFKYASGNATGNAPATASGAAEATGKPAQL